MAALCDICVGMSSLVCMLLCLCDMCACEVVNL